MRQLVTESWYEDQLRAGVAVQPNCAGERVVHGREASGGAVVAQRLRNARSDVVLDSI